MISLYNFLQFYTRCNVFLTAKIEFLLKRQNWGYKLPTKVYSKIVAYSFSSLGLQVSYNKDEKKNVGAYPGPTTRPFNR